jgi:hypothetical protein
VNVRILAEAEEDAQHEAEWYESRQEGLGIAFLDALARTIRTIESNPTRFAKNPGEPWRRHPGLFLGQISIPGRL